MSCAESIIDSKGGNMSIKESNAPPLDLSDLCSPKEIAQWVSEKTGLPEVGLDCFCSHAQRQEVGCILDSDDRSILKKICKLPNVIHSGSSSIFMIPINQKYECTGRQGGLLIFGDSCQCYAVYKKE